MKKLVSILLISTVLLQGCVLLDFFRKKEDATMPPEKVVQIDPKSLQACKPLPPLVDDVLDNTAKIVIVYKDCVLKQDNSIILLKKFSNYKEPAQ